MAGRARVVACRACRVPSCKASLIIMLGLTECGSMAICKFRKNETADVREWAGERDRV